MDGIMHTTGTRILHFSFLFGRIVTLCARLVHELETLALLLCIEMIGICCPHINAPANMGI